MKNMKLCKCGAPAKETIIFYQPHSPHKIEKSFHLCEECWQKALSLLSCYIFKEWLKDPFKVSRTLVSQENQGYWIRVGPYPPFQMNKALYEKLERKIEFELNSGF